MSKRAGAVPAETRENIINAARQELLTYGFQGSSLRRICAQAGVTTGAVYFFFKGKNDLFEKVIREVRDPLFNFMKEHYKKETDKDYEVTDFIINFYWKNKDTSDIILNHLDHPLIKEFMDEYIDMATEYYRDRIQRSSVTGTVDEFDLHQFIHMQVNAILTLLSHDFTQQEMLGHSRTVTRMLQGAFKTLLE